MPALRILALCLVAAIAYGIAFDQITARICVEYFSIGHPHILDTTSPTLLALAWGVIATWWVGLLLGAPLAFAATRGQWPKRSARSLIRPLAILLLTTAACAAVAGGLGFALARAWVVVLLEPLASRIPAERHVVFLTDLWAHSASYLAAFVGGVVWIRGVWRGRQRAGRAAGIVVRPVVVMPEGKSPGMLAFVVARAVIVGVLAGLFVFFLLGMHDFDATVHPEHGARVWMGDWKEVVGRICALVGAALGGVFGVLAGRRYWVGKPTERSATQ